MNGFFQNWVDLTALVLCFLLPFLFVVRVKKLKKKKVRAVPAYFLFFAPVAILVFIFFHLFENSFHAIEAAVAGKFKYDFRFYSLMLLGLVVAQLGWQLLNKCMAKCLKERYKNVHLFRTVAFIYVLTAPLIPLTPISAVPAICCTISLIALPFVRRKARTSIDFEMADDVIAVAV